MEDLLKIETEIIELRQKIILADKSYFVDSDPIMTDLEYDKLFNKLKELEEKYPQFDDKNSPTKRIGSDIDNSLPEKEHLISVLSLDKCYSINDLLDWIKKNNEKLQSNIELVVEPKIDGASVVLYYENGSLSYALTRGNGFFGNDITENIKTIRSIPLTIDYKEKLAIRGEIFIKKEDFKNFNEKYCDNMYSNPRNLASGSIRRLKSKETALFPLNIFLYEAFFIEDKINNHIDNLIFLKEMGFPINSHIGFFTNNNELFKKMPFKDAEGGTTEDIKEYIEKFSQIRNSLPYEIDGLVIKINNLEDREQLGFTQHHPRWALAYKFDAPLAQTKVLSIVTQIGRGGRATPVANLDPVELSGSTIARATLHNQDYIDSIGVNVGDWVSISKRGDVIPAVEEVLEKGDLSSPYKIPQNCPSCNSLLVKDGAHLFCQSPDCSKKLLGTLQYFVSRDQMDIESLGDKTLEFLFEKGFVKKIPDIYLFDYTKLIGFEGYKDRKINKIKESIEISKNKDFKTVLSSLGLKDIGGKVSELLVDNYSDIDVIIEKASQKNIEIFTLIDGVGESIAQSIINHFTNPNVLELIQKLKEIGLNFKQYSKKEENQSNIFLSGTKWVITGSFDNFKPREKAADIIKKFGGEIMDSVSSKTTYLLCGEDAGSKLTKAQTLGVKIIKEDEFIRIIKEEKI